MQWPGWARAAYVAVVTVLVVSGQVQVWVGPTGTVGDRLLEAVLVAGCTLPLMLRRWPLPVLLVVLGCATGALSVGSDLGQPWFAVLLALYGLGNRASTAASAVGAVAVAASVLWSDVPRLRAGADVSDVLPGWVVLAAAWGFGRWMRHRAEEQQVLLDRSARLAEEHEAVVAAVVAEEQARIARELHDLVAHALALIVVQSQAAGRVVAVDQEQARASLAAIEDAGREGLVELRRLLDVLEPGDAEGASRPGIGQLDELADRVRGTGLPVELVVSGTPRALPAGLDLSAYRIVQEALTNTLKHAGPARSTVAVHYLADAVEVDVSDDGTARTSPGPPPGTRVGRGLIGMHERTSLYGGTLVAGRDGDRGFRVRARFPLSVP